MNTTITATETIGQRVIRVIAEALGVEKGEVALKAKLAEYFGVNDFPMFAIIVGLETEFKLDISDEDAGGLKTVQDVVDYINQAMTTERRVIRVIAWKLEVEESRVIPTARLVEDLGANVVKITDMIMTLGDEFSLNLSGMDIRWLATVQDVINFTANAPMMIERRVIRVIAEAMPVEESQVVPTAKLAEDLDGDMTARLVVSLGLEKEFKLDISDEDAGEFRTVQDVIGYIKKRLDRKNQPRGN